MRLQALTKCAAVAGALALPFTLGVPTASATGSAGSASAISASGPVALPAIPAVTSAAQQPERKSVAELPANPLLEARLLNAAAGSGYARASVADLKAVKLGLSAHLVTAKCKDGTGVSNLVKARLNGRTLKAAATPNTTVHVNVPQVGNATVTLNRQVRAADGTLTVTAIEVSATIAGKTQTVSIASATCGKGTPSQPGQPSEPSDPGTPSSPATPPGEAPTPTPIPGDLPVTG
ncbi:hypothetical protein [Actinomadura sp. B10D3]|uniref:hypothetical protein n=1 Tax=Actinomadura sp. B10D3 TaxID=3153557 RepID=UPI00325DE4BC